MQFNSLDFTLFAVIVFSVYWILYGLKIKRVQNIFLLIASYTFYAGWDYRYLSLIALSSVVDYICGIKISQTKSNKKAYLITSIVMNLGCLFTFKYFNFFASELVSLLQFFSINLEYKLAQLVLPVGISFYTFQSMSYTVDVYKNKINAEKNIIDFLLYVSFFPQLVAGPIERASHLLPQIKNLRKITSQDIFNGLWLIYWGYFLKLFMADNLAQIVELAFTGSQVDIIMALCGTYAFAFQIFGDFAGYTFIAIGLAKLLGFDLMTNFLYPYFSKNPSEFWRNWHISLSTWLRDYLYIPLGGNRLGKNKTYRNLLITMFLGGLWHGAAWTFIIWGIYHGLLLIFYKVYQNRLTFMPSFISIIVMFHLVCLGWIFFRAESFEQSMVLIKSLGNFNIHESSIIALRKLIFYASFPMLINYYQFKSNSGNYLNKLPFFLKLFFYFVIYFLLFGFGEFGVKEFIYFQF